MCEEDLNAMYKLVDEDGKDNVLLWCNGKSTSQDCETQAVTTTRKRKAAVDHLVDKRQEKWMIVMIYVTVHAKTSQVCTKIEIHLLAQNVSHGQTQLVCFFWGVDLTH